MSKDPDVFLKHILESAERIEEYTDGISRENFLDEGPIKHAVVRQLEIIGEAATNIPDEAKDQYPDVLWNQIIGMRNILAHEYWRVDFELVWDTAMKKVPELKEAVRKLLTES